jgi:glycosyltransferase involved in cell wall biosynthesis
LLEIFSAAVASDDPEVDLVTIGGGRVEIPRGLTRRVIDLGFLDTAERDNAYAAAMAYVQPSLMESFSRTIMEAWLAGTPVLSRSQSTTVAWHCERSGGGLLFSGVLDLVRSVRLLRQDPAEAARMAERGRRYVLDNYTWPSVLDRMASELESLKLAGA